MLLTQGCMIGIRASLAVSIKGKDDRAVYWPIHQIAEELDVSFHFLTKILQVLTHAKIMESYKGPNGGIRLAKPPVELFLIDIVDAFNGMEVFNSCLLGFPGCGVEAPCPVHEQWAESKDQLIEMFRKTNLEKLSKDTYEKGFRY